eukprot:TRINITY_DN90410_c0_g1_i1.p1 TRINITY_DN90410_c0_g1~~TRINITY_DN90410_c0_g1_i1.p1  ORF type:complete len:304 (-),score=93.62 TRINITY_DN90410_c0_g1_i1:267-1178(-)
MDEVKNGSIAPSSEYARALQERVAKVRAEMQLQEAMAYKLRYELDQAQREADSNNNELADLRAHWVEEQPQREAFLQKTGEAERRLAERERRCAEALADHAAAELSKVTGGAASASSQGGKVRSGGDTARQHHQSLEQQRSKLAQLEGLRAKLAGSLQELRDAVRQETTIIGQLGSRGESLRRETRAVRTGAEAAEEGKARMQRKLEALDATSAASQQRQQLLEKQAEDLREEVLALRSELEASLAPKPICGIEDATARLTEAAWEMNRRLQEKVGLLQEELRKKDETLEQLRHVPSEPSVKE